MRARVKSQRGEEGRKAKEGKEVSSRQTFGDVVQLRSDVSKDDNDDLVGVEVGGVL